MNPLFLLSGIGMITVSLVSIIYWKKKSKIAFKFFLAGAIAWVVSVTFKVIVAIPMNPIVIEAFRSALPFYVSEPMIWIYIGILTGIFECGIVLAFAYFLQGLKKANWNKAVGFGIGFGAVEAFLLGLGSFIPILLAILIPEQLPKELLEGLPQSLWLIPVPIIERASALFIHLFSIVLIMYALRVGEWKWFWFSFLYKTIVDSIAGVALTIGRENLTFSIMWFFQIIFVTIAIIGFWGLQRIHKKWKQASLEIKNV